MSALPEAAFGFDRAEGTILQEKADPGIHAGVQPKDSIKFAVIGLDHNHIMGMTAAVQRGGGELVSVYATNPEAISDFKSVLGV